MPIISRFNDVSASDYWIGYQGRKSPGDRRPATKRAERPYDRTRAPWVTTGHRLAEMKDRSKLREERFRILLSPEILRDELFPSRRTLYQRPTSPDGTFIRDSPNKRIAGINVFPTQFSHGCSNSHEIAIKNATGLIRRIQT